MIELPFIIEWRCGCVLRHSLPRRKPQGKGGNGATDVAICNPYVPIGAEAWRIPPAVAWRAIEELPAEWGLVDHNKVRPA